MDGEGWMATGRWGGVEIGRGNLEGGQRGRRDGERSNRGGKRLAMERGTR